MFDISFGEIFLVLVVAVIFIGHKDLPVVIRAVVRGINHVKRFTREVRQLFDDISKEAGVEDIKDELEADMNYIRGDDGKLYPSYDISDFVDEKSPPKIKDE